MKILKPLLKHPRTQSVLAHLIGAIIRLVYFTSRKRFEIHPDSAKYMNGQENALFAFWHGRSMLMPCINPPRRLMKVVSSFHRDGLLMSKMLGTFGMQTIWGSSSKGGTEALRGIVKSLKAGDNVSLTPDGPRGPRCIAAPGISLAAQLSGKPIIPVTSYASRAKIFDSWDLFMLALPFSRITFCVGAPIMLEKSLPSEEARMTVQTRLNQLTEECDAKGL